MWTGEITFVSNWPLLKDIKINCKTLGPKNLLTLFYVQIKCLELVLTISHPTKNPFRKPINSRMRELSVLKICLISGF